MSEDNIKERLTTTSAECLKCYEAWKDNEKDEKAREAMQDAIHELRKVSSRLEIEMAKSERAQMTQKPLPIPPHRSSKNGPKGNRGEGADDAGNGGPTVQRKPQRRRAPAKKASGGNE